MRIMGALSLLAVLVLVAAGQQPSSTLRKFSPAAQRFQEQLDAIENNARANPVQRKSVQVNAADVNAWFREGGYKLPKGVQKVTFHSHPDTIVGDATVDFDQLKEGKRNLNPLLSMFSGVHDVEVTADASADQGKGKVNVQSVSIDSVGVPRLALELFVKKYLSPKYPNLGLDNAFAMPDHIDSATVGNEAAIVTQK